MAAAFSRLPLEMLIIILHVPDLPSIYKFICASTRVNAAFEIDPTNILDSTIERSIPDFKHLARLIAIRSSFSSSSKPTYDEFLTFFSRFCPNTCSLQPQHPFHLHLGHLEFAICY
jgi:hypothetical protein